MSDSTGILACILLMFIGFGLGVGTGSDYTSMKWKKDVISHNAAHYEVNQDGEVYFIWNTPLKEENK